MMNNFFEAIRQEILPLFKDDVTGHDMNHIDRVISMSRYLQQKEGGDLELIELSALLHDISDHKFNGGQLNKGGEVAEALLIKNGYSAEKSAKVKAIVDHISFKGAKTEIGVLPIEAQIVQDADRLDALGAIGIARTFAFGGNRKQALHDPKLNPKHHESFEEYVNAKTTSINHFYEKLLLLKDRLNTETARKIGQKRHDLMVEFLDHFHAEWTFNVLVNE